MQSEFAVLQHCACYVLQVCAMQKQTRMFTLECVGYLCACTVVTHSCGARQVNTAYGKDKETAVKAETLKKAALMVQEEMLALLQVWLLL